MPVTLADELQGVTPGGPSLHRVQLTPHAGWFQGAQYRHAIFGAARCQWFGANGLLVLPKRTEPFAAGETVNAILLDHPERRAVRGRLGEPMRVAGVVLAAGESRRMGQLKALLPFGSRTVIEQVLQPLLDADLSEVAVVLGHRAGEIAAGAGAPACAAVVQHELPARHDLFRASGPALARPPYQMPICWPSSNQPQIGLQVIQQLLAAHARTRRGLVIPVWQGKRGHPLLLAAGVPCGGAGTGAGSRPQRGDARVCARYASSCPSKRTMSCETWTTGKIMKLSCSAGGCESAFARSAELAG